jgi:hypothetical protein
VISNKITVIQQQKKKKEDIYGANSMRGFLFSFDFISILVAQSRSMSASGQNIERLQREREDISFIYFSFHTWTVRVCLRL